MTTKTKQGRCYLTSVFAFWGGIVDVKFEKTFKAKLLSVYPFPRRYRIR